MIGRGVFILFLGTLAAANFHLSSMQQGWFTTPIDSIGFFFGFAQMAVGVAMIVLGRVIQERMEELHAQLDHDPEEKAKVSGTPALLQTSVGLCYSAEQIPQGLPIVVNTQQITKGI